MWSTILTDGSGFPLTATVGETKRGSVFLDTSNTLPENGALLTIFDAKDSHHMHVFAHFTSV